MSVFVGVIRMLDNGIIRGVYRNYGFEEMQSAEEGVLVFTIKSGHFHNADIVICDGLASGEDTFAEYKASGYAPQIRNYENSDVVAKTLFTGFFSAESSRKRLIREYEAFTRSIVSSFSESAQYNYINSSYTVNEQDGELNIVDEIYNEILSDTPTLFLIEAAAGFGKTCTAYEFVNRLLQSQTEQVPLFSELSRNRQAKIFRYVLLDEIDRTFPSLSSKLVLSEISNGNVPVILDGFDELLHRSKDNDGYENAEPMLETIGTLLKGKAKVILTTRRTAIFDGDEFHDWIELHEEDFKILRIRIAEPSVKQWLPEDRFDKFEKNNFPLERLSNPVLLSYLRSISDEDFEGAISDLDALVEHYFTSMLERERRRQDLKMTIVEQHDVLSSIAKDMMNDNYTSLPREDIVTLISEFHSTLIEKVRLKYDGEERPSSDEIANKLASHALFDRDENNDKGIGFVNEFVLGNYCSEVILKGWEARDEWVGDEIFIEPVVISGVPRSLSRRQTLYDALSFSLHFLPATERITYSISLLQKAEMNLEKETIENLQISSVSFGAKAKFENCVFVNARFVEVKFSLGNFSGSTFINCHFYSCTALGFVNGGEISILGSNDNNGFIEKVKINKVDNVESSYGVITERSQSVDKYILEKFWPRGRKTFFKHRPIKGITSINSAFSQEELELGIYSLQRRNLIIEPDKKSFVQINIAKLNEIVKILERYSNG